MSLPCHAMPCSALPPSHPSITRHDVTTPLLEAAARSGARNGRSRHPLQRLDAKLARPAAIPIHRLLNMDHEHMYMGWGMRGLSEQASKQASKQLIHSADSSSSSSSISSSSIKHPLGSKDLGSSSPTCHMRAHASRGIPANFPLWPLIRLGFERAHNLIADPPTRAKVRIGTAPMIGTRRMEIHDICVAWHTLVLPAYIRISKSALLTGLAHSYLSGAG